MADKLRVAVELLRRRCLPDELGFCNTSADVPPLKDFIGQERAIRAMQFGLNMTAPGYNIYVSGPTGTGKNTYVKIVVDQASALGQQSRDWCYVYNFDNPDQPLALSFPAGQGMRFKKNLEEFIAGLRTAITKAFESSELEQSKNTIVTALQGESKESFMRLHQEAADSGFILKQTSDGVYFLPLVEGRPIEPEEYQALPDEEREEIDRKGRELRGKLEEEMQSGRNREKVAREKIEKLEMQLSESVTDPLVEKIRALYMNDPGATNFLNCLIDDMKKNIENFKPAAGSEDKENMRRLSNREAFFNRYEVNLFVNNGDNAGAPAVVEHSPNYYNLFGKVEYRSQMGTLSTDHTMIKAGAVHRANGGFIILQARDVIADPVVWDMLKRTIKNRQLAVENIGEQYRMVPSASLRPAPIPIDLKVILIGTPAIYHMMLSVDEDFSKFFKVKVEFDIEMSRTEENLCYYVSFAGSVCTQAGLKHFDNTGLAELIEYGSRLCGDQTKLSTRFNEVVEIIYESAAWAGSAGTDHIGASHVVRAIEERAYRCSRVEERTQEMMARGIININTSDAIVGQVNGLSVISTGDYVFGRPSRITARVFMGGEGVVNIERETEMSGQIHSKGHLTLVGYLGGKFAQDKPLSLSARITFEQMYSGVEGDSASSAELYALLSALSGLPIKQGLAVTGSVDQRGEVQAIGGVTEKIEGFFALCKARGFTGVQGVIIPRSNLEHLMLNHEVVKAAEQGFFHIYAVQNIEEGIELLTGTPAGRVSADGKYPVGSVFYLVDRKLRYYTEEMTNLTAR